MRLWRAPAARLHLRPRRYVQSAATWQQRERASAGVGSRGEHEAARGWGCFTRTASARLSAGPGGRRRWPALAGRLLSARLSRAAALGRRPAGRGMLPTLLHSFIPRLLAPLALLLLFWPAVWPLW